MTSQPTSTMPSELHATFAQPGSVPMVDSKDHLKCRFETAFEGLEPFRSCWDDAVIRLGGSIYMSYDWCRTWWQFYGQGKELRIFLFTSADRVVGILPLYIDSLGWGPLRFRVARLVGANIPPKVDRSRSV